MAKMALCIKRKDLVDLNRILQYPELQGMMLADAPVEFLRLTTSLEDRATCETDPSLLQLLPYVLIQRADTGQYFTYCRGKGGNEARLHGNLSIGVGGHVDTDLPEDNVFEAIEDDLLSHLEDTAVREITEEIGIQFLAEDEDAAEEESQDLLEVPAGMWTGEIIYDDTNPVGQVHLGLLFRFIIPDASYLGATEVGIIEGSEWHTMEELLAPETFDRLENWSKIVVQTIGNYEAELAASEDYAEDDEGELLGETV
jgi:predicted NUDIX family phosphoesterase